MTRMTDYAPSSPDHTPIENRQKSAAGVEYAHTQWLRVWTIIFAGIVAALHIGKAPIAVPLLRQNLGLSLAFASWIIGAYAIVGAVAGLPAGILISFVGARRSLVIGLLVIGAASCAGALATSGPTLLVTRVLEGAGFLMVAIAAPMLLRMLTAAKDRDSVFGWWAIYFTAGSVIAMLAGPLVARFGWQSLWYTTGLLSLAYSVVA
jgi:MFS family permease